MRLALLLLLTVAAADNMRWTDSESGAVFDWSVLGESEDFVVISPTSDDVLTVEYTFAFGRHLTDPCTTEPVSAVERDVIYGQVFQDCSVLGRHEMSSVELIDKENPGKGISVTYSGGHICSSVEKMLFNIPRKIVFRLICGENEGEFSEIDTDPFDLSECETVMERVTAAGCPVKYVPTAWSQTRKIWLLLFFGLLCYLLIGTFINYSNGARGLSSIPHSKLLTNAWLSILHCFSWVKSLRSTKEEERYEDV